MIAAIIRWSVQNRLLVLLLALILAGWGMVSLRQIPLDAIPDLSDVQVIVRTTYPGQAPQVVEDQVTYPCPRRCWPYRAPPRCAAIRFSVIPSST